MKLIRPKQTQLGFGHIALLLFLFFIVATIGLVAWRLSTSGQNKEPNTTINTSKHESISFNAVGDFSSSRNADLVLSKIGKSKSNFTLALGDLGYAGNGTEQAWCDFVKARIGADHTFELIAGNHDDGTSDGDILEYRKCLPDKLNVKGDYGIEYFFDYKDLARIIMISPDIDNRGFAYTKDTSHYDWLKTTIEDAKTPWVIVGMHKNCITPGIKTCEIGGDLMNLLVEKKVDLILQGHEHGYMRSKQLALSTSCSSITINKTNSACIVDEGVDFKKAVGSLLVISGAGGYDLRDINIQDPEIGYFDTWNGNNVGKSFGFTKTTIDTSSLSVEFIPVNGDFNDYFEIKK